MTTGPYILVGYLSSDNLVEMKGRETIKWNEASPYLV